MSAENKKVALVFGGRGYLGSAITDKLRGENWIVVTAGRSTEPDQYHLSSDITDVYSVQSVVDTIFSRYGHLDAVIHASSPKLERVPMEKSDSVLSELHMRVAVDGTKNLATTCLHLMNNNGTFIVITSETVNGDVKGLKMGTYPLAKKKQHELVTEIAKENKHKVRIFEIMPGFLPGGLNRDLPASVRESFAQKGDGTMSNPQEIAEIISKLLKN